MPPSAAATKTVLLSEEKIEVIFPKENFVQSVVLSLTLGVSV